MKRKILGAVLGFFAWFVVATVLDRLLRLAWPHYAEVLKAFAFTLGMLIARLVEGVASTLAAGFVTAWVARKHPRTALATGMLLLALFVPTHVMIWDKFPIWYHVLFLSSLVPLTLLGARLLPVRAG